MDLKAFLRAVRTQHDSNIADTYVAKSDVDFTASDLADVFANVVTKSSVTEEQPSSGGSTPAATPTILWDINTNGYYGEDFKDYDIVDLDNFDYDAFDYDPAEVDGAIRINFIESGYLDVTFRFE